MNLIKNKKGIADVSDPTFWGIGAAIWIVLLIAIWKMTYQGETDITRFKIMASVIMLPITYGFCYILGNKG